MGWEEINVNANTEGSPWVSIGVHGRGRYTQAKITMSRTVVRHLGIKSGDKVLLRIGNGEHGGWVDIIKSKSGQNGFLASGRKQGPGNLAFRFSAAHLNLPVHKTTKVAVDDASVILYPGPSEWMRSVRFELPKWARGKQ